MAIKNDIVSTSTTTDYTLDTLKAKLGLKTSNAKNDVIDKARTEGKDYYYFSVVEVEGNKTLKLLKYLYDINTKTLVKANKLNPKDNFSTTGDKALDVFKDYKNGKLNANILVKDNTNFKD